MQSEEWRGRILSQIMDNAVKYGNGEGITVDLNKKEEGFYFIIKNKGEVPAEKELPYIFNSFWRGSNAGNISGNGIRYIHSMNTVALMSICMSCLSWGKIMMGDNVYKKWTERN